ncbi:MAG: lysostaphin resistance A-like protein [Sarcina sp.]
MKILKRSISLLIAVIGIPVLTYQLISHSVKWVFELYCIITNTNVAALTVNEINQILVGHIYLASVLGEFLAVAILFIIFGLLRKNLYKRCNFRKVSSKKLAIISLMMIGFNFIAMTFIYFVQDLSTKYQASEVAMHSSLFSPLEIIGTVIIVPILEEILFRGAIFSILKNNVNIYIAIILQGVVFAVMHSMGGGFVQASYTFVLGLLLLFASYYANSMIGDIVGHMVFNLFGLIVLPILQVIWFNPIVYIVIGVILVIIAYYLYRKDMNGKKLSFTDGIK